MKCRRRWCSAFVLVLAAALLPPPPALAIDEPDRLWLVGERAFADGLHALARRTLDRFVIQYPRDPRHADAVLLLGKSRLALGELEPALEAFRRAQGFRPPPGASQEARFWEGEALFRLKRYPEARAAYDDVLRLNAASPFAPDALYGFGWCELELGRPEPAAAAFRDLLATWPEHARAPAAGFYLARALVEQKRYDEAVARLTALVASPRDPRLLPDAMYLLGWAKVAAGDARGGLVDLRAFVAAYPTHEQAPAARTLITESLARSTDPEEQRDAYRALMDQNPPTAAGLADAAGLATRLGHPADAEAAWRKLRTLFPSDPLARRAALEQGTAAFKRNDYKEAAAHAESAAQSEQPDVRAEAWLLAGESELKLRRLGPALKAFESVVAMKDVEAGIRYRALAGAGLVREEQKEWRAALTAYESVASESPDETLRSWARDRAVAVKKRLSQAPPRPSAPGPAPGDKKAKPRS